MFKQSKTGLLVHRTVSLQRRQITTKQLVTGSSPMDKRRQTLVSLHGECDGNLGVVKMNKEHRFNILSEGLISDIIRGLTTMDNDHIMHGIYLGTEKGQHFSNGTDFRTITHMKSEQEFERIQAYFQQVYGLQTHVAHINKPLFAVAPGHSFNSGASLLAACGHPMTTLDSKVGFNEVTFGFVPHSGASYYQSRMKGEFGTFMALTGLPIHGADAVKVDLARGVVHKPLEYHQEISDHISTLPMPLVGGNEHFLRHKSDPHNVSEWQKKMFQKHAETYRLSVEDLTRYGRQKGNHDMEDHLREIEDRIGSSTAEADYRYMQQIRHDARKVKQEEDSWLEQFKDDPTRGDVFTYRNYYTDIMNYVEPRIQSPWSKFAGEAANHQMLIDRCFRSNSVEEIMDNLRRESHPFAKECLEAMQRNSVQSMQLALKMVRKAQNLDYKGCLKMELNVGFNRLKDADFDVGCSSILFSAKPKGSKWHKTPEWQRAFTESEINRYFEGNKLAEGVNLNVVENALLPTKMFYKRFADPVRLYLNESSTTSPTIREAFELEMKNALHEMGIDVRNIALTPETVRDHLAAKLQQERVQQKQIERFEQLMHDTKLREEYFGNIATELEKYENNEFFYEKVNKHIEETFQQAFLNRLNTIFERSAEAHDLEKRRMFLRLKKFYFRERILQNSEENILRATKQAQSLPFQQMHLTEKWDQNWRRQENPELWRSPLSYLSKAIGRVSLTMPELAKTYLTDPEQRDALSMFTLDKQELEKLNADILQNPQKYEMIFEGTTLPELEKNFELIKWTRDLGHAKHEELEHWYRVFNDGKCPVDSFPYIQEYNEYKHWVDQIEYKALGTLRTAVNKLLIDHEQAEEFTGPLKKLQALASGTNRQVKESKSRGKDKQSLMGQPRPLSEIEQSITGMLQSDPHFKAIFQPNEQNAQIKALQNEFRKEILQMAQLVLLDRHSDFKTWSESEQQEMARVLGQLTDPDYKEQGQLNMIDQFLRRKNGEELIRDVFRLVSPFVYESFGKRLDEECDQVLKRIQFADKSQEYIFFYFMNKNFPNFYKNPVLNKLENYSSEEHGLAMAKACFPHWEEVHRRKEMMSIFGSRNVGRSHDLEAMKSESIQQTREELAEFAKFEEMANQPEKSYAKEDYSDPKVLAKMNLTDQEYREMIHLQKQMHDMFMYLHNHKYEIDHHMTKWDNLKCVGQSYEHYGLDISMCVGQEHQKKMWDSHAQYANFLWQMKQGLYEVASQSPIDAVSFIEHHRTSSPQAASLYYAARQERTRVQSLKDAQTKGSRKQIISQEINDFNSLQQAVKKQSQLLSSVRHNIQNLPKQTQTHVNSFLTEQRRFIDFEALDSAVQSKDFNFLKNPSLVCDVEKMFQAAKHDVLKLDSTVDVVSLNQLRKTIRNDFSADSETAQIMLNLVEHVDQNSKYLSNQQRQAISVKDYFERHHFTSYQAYQKYADDLLKHKVDQILGKSGERKSAQIDWQLGKNRTMPSEHQINESVDSVLHRDDIYDVAQREPQILGSGLLGKEIIEDDANQPEQVTMVDYKDPVTGKIERMSQRDLMNKKIYREAKTLVQLPHGMEPTKNLYENLLLKEMLEPEVKHNKTQELIEDYINMRLKGAMANPRFAEVMKTDDAHLFIKTLREECIVELGLNQETKPSQLSMQSLDHVFHNQLFLDPENVYNLQNLNNEHAIGFDNFEARSAANSADGNFKAAHESVFDKLLSDYFLSKRGEYKEMNGLASDLAKVFENDFIAKSSNGNAMDHLMATKLTQDLEKGSEPRLVGDTFRDLVNLDVLTHRVLQKSKNGLSKDLSKLSIKETDHPDFHTTQVPEYFPMLDCRKPAGLYVEDKLREVIGECFEMRAKVEKQMTRSELAAFDQTLAKYLQKDKLLTKLRQACDSDYHWCDTGRSLVNHARDSEESNRLQGIKEKHDQRAYNKNIKNEDAFFKELSFAAMRDQDHAEAAKKNREWDAMLHATSFDEYYKRELRQDIKREAREIKPEHYKTRKPWDRPVGTPYKQEEEKIQDLHNEYKLYQERKLEQQERIRLFYILEQFNEEARKNPNSASEGQRAIQEYFADPDNTYFFDKNKLM